MGSIPTQVPGFFSSEKDLGTCIQVLLLMIFDELGLMARASSRVPEVTASSPRGVHMCDVDFQGLSGKHRL